MVYCRICDRNHDIPDDATQIGTTRGVYQLYRFPADGSTHDVRKPSEISEQTRLRMHHRRWHENRGLKKPDCSLCQPQPPQPATELLEAAITALEEIPAQQSKKEFISKPFDIVLEEVESESDSNPSLTTMAAAFQRIRR